MINSNLIDTLQKDALDVAIVYSGNPCQLAIAHVLAVPVIYYDLEGPNLYIHTYGYAELILQVSPTKPLWHPTHRLT
ncbi:hypothetical protein ANCDUO_16077 [Ancylostoma duodenale]|uniref:Uncharacterized protein n=1 Tax=Ancylostoma duodenale TaxID=51022 RepID=A0A0C2CBS7_9BILA|nr:hypothetical protein ANCDUO_16077 [Ancylostoma duodenale]